jgi:two-component system sensor histidine kinase UhpB
MMKQLHPLILTELGLKATLEDLVTHWEDRNTPISFSLHCDDAVDKLDRTIVIQIFRVIQESLTNIIRHANANHVTINIKIKSNPDALDLSIIDDGQGCNLDKITSGFGLLGMKERINLLGGSFKIQSQVNQGTQINAHLPLS